MFGKLTTGTLTGPCENTWVSINWNVTDWEAGPCESVRAYIISRITIVVLAVAPHLGFLHLILGEVRLVHRADDVFVHSANGAEDGKPP